MDDLAFVAEAVEERGVDAAQRLLAAGVDADGVAVVVGQRDLGLALIHRDPMALLGEQQGGRQSHGAGADDDDGLVGGIEDRST